MLAATWNKPAAKRKKKVTKKVARKAKPRGFWLARDIKWEAAYVAGKHKPVKRRGYWNGDVDWAADAFELALPQLKLEPGAKPRRVVGLGHLRFEK